MIARWTESVGSEDCHGRAVWGLGSVLGRSQDQELRSAAGRLFELSLPTVLKFSSPHAWAYSLLGIQEYLTSYPGDREAQKVRFGLNRRRLVEMYESIRTVTVERSAAPSWVLQSRTARENPYRQCRRSPERGSDNN